MSALHEPIPNAAPIHSAAAMFACFINFC